MTDTDIKDISPTELEVLKVLWQSSPLNANDIVQQLNQKDQWHEKTVKTLLNRLVNKGAVGFDKDGRAYNYYPLLSQQSFQSRESQSFIKRVFGGKLAPLVAGFAGSSKLTQDDVAELKQLIDAWEKEQGHD
ncbi:MULTISPECIES: BlaI/MecI/CopY family transcriptional regulator [Shewanella]|uniref:BlaI/MecI/CopY family transcriptional regulator n=2 Tax=Shewanella TaxID=22 RepID=A0A975AL34_9GAMM|nr:MULTISPECIES: BlaI/MecI/CopY family transcriptional regulator [Shewanella]QSX29838.1 BlaI/MecI/CopY family transcriptional regulator [Shewanella cyperi]QSX37010.1 BlaI/MecI/CopY family transcriptional regulator [Shewanella sedimentimangrovi]QSX40622.1 BlaI/MecI/CopY family transcriptional regulator [Shewanella cyperi]